MDDLDYSVIIAERDWESFYVESEECSIQQTWLASLDDSGFSDSEDEKGAIRVPDLELQIGDHEPKKEPNAATKSKEVDYIAETMSEEPESLSYKTDNRSATHTAVINLNDVSTTHPCSTSDSSVIATIFTNQTDPNIREHNENHIEDKSCQAVGEANIFFSCNQEGSHVGSLEENSPKKEKERWFVTVNDSPVKQKVKSGQKKGRKKKTSRKLVRHRLVTERHFSVLNKNKEEKKDIKDKTISQNELVQPSQTYSEHINLDPSPCPFSKELILDSFNDKELVLSAMKEHEKAASKKTSVPKIKCISEESLSNVEEENTSCVFNFKYKADSDVLTETFKSQPHASVNSHFSEIPTICLQLQNDAVVNDQNICATTPDHPMSINSLHRAFKKLQSDGSRLLWEETITSSENLQNQEYLTQAPKELQLSSQENHASQIKCLEADEGPNGPVYALSSFWEEMEKLTINDILHLRSLHNKSPMSRSVISDESDVHIEIEERLTSKHDGSMDDSADSDYFTHVDESKPDRSSCELSVFSDCDEEFLQIPNRNENSCNEPQYPKEQIESLMSTYIPNNNLNLNTDTELLDIIELSNQDRIPHHFYPTALSFGQTADNQSMFTFSDTFGIDMNGAMSLDRWRITAVSCPFVHNLSVCELYDDFFSEFDLRNFLFFSPQYKSVPIFNASHSVIKDMIVPRIGELDFHADFKQVNIPLSDLPHISSQTEMPTYPLGMPNLCFLMSQRGNWNNVFSHRRVSFIGKGSTWYDRDRAWIFPKETKKKCVSTRAGVSPLYEVGRQFFLQLVEPEQHAVFIPKKDNFVFSIKQADMCLICIAFASWVLKSSNSQSTDTWKAALLANLSAISAIQYLRKYEK